MNEASFQIVKSAIEGNAPHALALAEHATKKERKIAREFLARLGILEIPDKPQCQKIYTQTIEATERTAGRLYQKKTFPIIEIAVDVLGVNPGDSVVATATSNAITITRIEK